MDILMNILNSLPGAVAQGLIWGIMAIGVYITYQILDIADLTVDGSICTGGSVCVMMIINGYSVPVSMLAAVAAGADGVMVEVHNDPMHAWCDGAQSLNPEQFAALAQKMRVVREAVAQ